MVAQICTMTVRYLVKKYTPATFSFVKSVIGEKDVLLFYDEWLWWTLEFLPLDHLMRIVDCYLLEGIKILYRVAIVLLKSFHTHASKSVGHIDLIRDFRVKRSTFSKYFYTVACSMT